MSVQYGKFLPISVDLAAPELKPRLLEIECVSMVLSRIATATVLSRRKMMMATKQETHEFARWRFRKRVFPVENAFKLHELPAELGALFPVTAPRDLQLEGEAGAILM